MRVDRVTTKRPVKKVRKAGVGLDPVKANITVIMSKKVKTVRADMSIAAAMEVMVTSEIGHLPVIGLDGELVGILSKSDLVREQFINGETGVADVKVTGKNGVRYSPGPGFHEDGEAIKTVSDVMSTRVQTVRDDATIAEAATVMAKHRVHGLPVVTKKNALVGFVSTFDVVDWVASA